MSPASGPPGRCRIPTVMTERLVLRAFEETDLDAYAALNVDPEMGRYLWGTSDRASTWRGMASLVGHWHLRGYGMWALADRSTRQFLGRAGLYNAEGWPGIEMAWSVARSHWNRGLATEAGRAVLRYAFEVVGVDHVISLIHPDNAASIRVAEKLGATARRRARVLQREWVVYGVDRGQAVL